MSGHDDPRRAAELLQEIARGATRTPFPAGPQETAATWGEVLFDIPVGGTEPERPPLRDPLEPSSLLLQALTERHEQLVRHMNELPGRAWRWYLEEQAGVEPLPYEPDRVMLEVAGDAKRLPATIPKGSLAKAGRDLDGGERLYSTTEPLRVLGGRLLGGHSYGVTDERDNVVAHDALALSGLDAKGKPAPPFHPFASSADAPAAHELYIASDLL
ncbi:MAG: hypothetical protein M3340_19790, partial [Actinomycetota bacterium]|nr:hypothetical protein [Actinomycetota bacterium]